MPQAQIDLESVLDDLLMDRLSTETFEQVVATAWEQGRFVLPAPPELPERLLRWSERGREYTYGKPTDRVEFSCRYLFGAPGRPGGFMLIGPGEAHPTGRLADKNRPPHAHASGRIAVVAEGGAAFYVHRRQGERDVVVKAELSLGDVLLWPAGTLHTFDAGARRFSLFCALGEFISPAREHFPVDAPGGPLDLDALAVVQYDRARGGA